MSYSILNAQQDLIGVLHGTQLNQIQGVSNGNFALFNRAARQLLLDVDPQETKRTVEFVNPIYNGVFDYPIAADVKGNKIIDIRPQVQRIPRDVWSQAYNQAFDVAKQNIFALANMFTMNFNTGIKTIRIDAPFLNPPIIVNQADNTTDNGTWTVGGTASNLSTNNTNFVQGAGSLQFDIATGAGWIENSTMSAVDLTEHLNQASEFVNGYVPTGASLTSFNLRWGSSSSDYYTSTITQNQQGVAFQNGWNLGQYIWSTATTVGSPDVTAINYVRVTFNVTADMTGCLVNGINSILGTILEYEYYSKYLFRNSSTGAFQETALDASDLINLDTDSYNLFFNLSAFYAVQQQQGKDALAYDGKFFKDEYDKGVERYKALYKSELQKPQSSYYVMPQKGYDRYNGRIYN